ERLPRRNEIDSRAPRVLISSHDDDGSGEDGKIVLPGPTGAEKWDGGLLADRDEADGAVDLSAGVFDAKWLAGARNGDALCRLENERLAAVVDARHLIE